MGRISYRPKKGQHKAHQKEEVVQVTPEVLTYEELEEESGSEGEEKVITINNHVNNKGRLDNLKIVGDMECEYHIFIEDYVYTYLYQYAAADLSKESSAALIGEVYGDSKEIIVRGIIPIKTEWLSGGNEWISVNALEEVESKRKQYFKDQDIIGWMHMQPGYGTMLTMKELREHKEVFEGTGSICMLVDSINKIETLFVYEDEELKEQSGYCMYYERNEQMQQYMLDFPFSNYAKEEMKDSVVNQFREIGKIRKAEYLQRKSVNVTVMAVSIILIALTGVIVKMNDSKSNSQTLPVSSTNDYLGQADEVLEQMDVITNTANEYTDHSIEDVKPSEEALSEEMPIKPDKDEGVESETVEYETYVVKEGDTLANISYKKYGEARKSVDIAKLNGIDDTNQIYVGQEIKLPEYK